MVAPQVPTGHAIGHVVLNHQSHGRLLYPVGVLALERGEVGLIGREGATTGQTAMCGVANMQASEIGRHARGGRTTIMNGAGVPHPSGQSRRHAVDRNAVQSGSEKFSGNCAGLNKQAGKIRRPPGGDHASVDMGTSTPGPLHTGLSDTRGSIRGRSEAVDNFSRKLVSTRTCRLGRGPYLPTISNDREARCPSSASDRRCHPRWPDRTVAIALPRALDRVVAAVDDRGPSQAANQLATSPQFQLPRSRTLARRRDRTRKRRSHVPDRAGQR